MLAVTILKICKQKRQYPKLIEKTYLDRETIVLHGGVNQEQEWVASESGHIFLLANDLLEHLENSKDLAVDLSATHVEADDVFLGVDAAVELKHLVEVVLVDYQLLLFAIDLSVGWNREASLEVDHLSVDTTKEGTDDIRFVLGSPHVVIQDVGDDGWVDDTLQLFKLHAKV
jgi:hypothetical protein